MVAQYRENAIEYESSLLGKGCIRVTLGNNETVLYRIETMNKGMINRHTRELDFLMRLFDLVGLVVSGFLTLYWSFGTFSVTHEQATIGLIVVLLWLVVANVHTNLYRPWRGISLWVEIGDVTWVLFLVLVLVGVVVYDMIGITAFIPKMLFGKWLAVGWGTLTAYRITLRYFLRWVRIKGYNRRRIVIAGAGDLGRKVANELTKATWTGLDVVAFFDDAYCNESHENVDGIPVVGTLDDLHPFVKENAIAQIWIALPLRAELRIKEVLRTLRHSMVDILFVPDIFGFDLFNHSINQISGIPVMNLSTSPMVGTNRWVKAVEDRFLAFFILLFCWPFAIMIAIGVKLSSPGPVFFKQERIGWNGQHFQMLKFRSMPVNVEASTGPVWAKAGEKRATPFGAFLRRTNLDELPQFINVLRGEMSIVGPRPERPVFVEQFKDEIDGYMKKHLVKAGITGWAQVHGWRGNTSLEKRIEYDLYYIENWSLLLDIRIILMTILKIWKSKNAY